MARKKQAEVNGGLELDPETRARVERTLLYYALRKPDLEPVMMRFARMLPLPKVEKQIEQWRDYHRRRRDVARVSS